MQFICVTLQLTSTACAFTNVNAACAPSLWQFVFLRGNSLLVIPAAGWGVCGSKNMAEKGKTLLLRCDLRYLRQINDEWFLCIRVWHSWLTASVGLFYTLHVLREKQCSWVVAIEVFFVQTWSRLLFNICVHRWIKVLQVCKMWFSGNMVWFCANGYQLTASWPSPIGWSSPGTKDQPIRKGLWLLCRTVTCLYMLLAAEGAQTLVLV